MLLVALKSITQQNATDVPGFRTHQVHNWLTTEGEEGGGCMAPQIVGGRQQNWQGRGLKFSPCYAKGRVSFFEKHSKPRILPMHLKWYCPLCMPGYVNPFLLFGCCRLYGCLPQNSSNNCLRNARNQLQVGNMVIQHTPWIIGVVSDSGLSFTRMSFNVHHNFPQVGERLVHIKIPGKVEIDSEKFWRELTPCFDLLSP